MLQPPSCGLVRRNHFVPCVLPQRHGMTLVPLRPEIQCHSSPPFFFVFDHHFFFPAQLFGGFTLSDLLDKPWSQVPSLLPPGTCLPFLSRIGFSIPTARRFYRMLLTEALALSADHFSMQEKVPTSMCSR